MSESESKIFIPTPQPWSLVWKAYDVISVLLRRPITSPVFTKRHMTSFVFTQKTYDIISIYLIPWLDMFMKSWIWAMVNLNPKDLRAIRSSGADKYLKWNISMIVVNFWCSTHHYSNQKHRRPFSNPWFLQVLILLVL